MKPTKVKTPTMRLSRKERNEILEWIESHIHNDHYGLGGPCRCTVPKVLKRLLASTKKERKEK